MASPLKQFEHLKIQLKAIISATNNFADENCIGKGGFGKVYKGEIDNTMVALKRLDRVYGQGDPEFWKEIMMLSVYRHENIVSLLGYCDDCGEKILMYEYLPKKSLDWYLKSSELTWVRRLKICIGAARGLEFLHNPAGTQQRLLHRDIKSSNILLDENWNAKISDFGLSKYGPANQKNTFLISHPVGTLGYYDPQYAEYGFLSKESDIYSFGVVLCEVLCGRFCMEGDKLPPLVGLTRESFRQNTVNQIVFENIRDQINPVSLDVFSKIAYQCLMPDRDERPSITEIRRELEAALKCQGSETSIFIPFAAEYKFHEIQLATNNFDESLVIGYGGSGKFYKGNFLNGSSVVAAALQRIDSRADHEFLSDVERHLIGLRADEFLSNVERFSTIRHCNIVSLIGYCNQGDVMILIYEYIPNGSLYDHLHKLGTHLSWLQRLSICIDAALGLNYLHTGVEGGVIRIPFCSSRVLLDESLTAKIIANLNWVKIIPSNQTYIEIPARGSPSRLWDGDYRSAYRLTPMDDVQDFGVLLFEVLCRKPAYDYSIQFSGKEPALEIRAIRSIKKGKLKKMIDSDIRDQIAPQCLEEFVQIAVACVEKHCTMAEVLASLESVLNLQEKFNNSLQPTSKPARRTLFHRIFGGN